MRRGGHMGTGTVSLILMFSVLCIVIFALLTVSTAAGEHALAEKAAQTQQAYYQADSRAADIAAQVLAARDSRPGEIDGVAVTWNQGEEGGLTASFACPVDQERTLLVELELNGEDFAVKRWQCVRTGEWEADDSIEVWDGE